MSPAHLETSLGFAIENHEAPAQPYRDPHRQNARQGNPCPVLQHALLVLQPPPRRAQSRKVSRGRSVAAPISRATAVGRYEPDLCPGEFDAFDPSLGLGWWVDGGAGQPTIVAAIPLRINITLVITKATLCGLKLSTLRAAFLPTYL